jgi:cytochrome o ubiquinol oxidase subunit 2
VKQAVGKIRCATVALLAFLTAGCDRMVVLNPKGPIADAERGLMIDAFVVMMIVVVPVIVLTLLFALRYRANRNARYEPTWAYSVKVDAVVWLVPALIVIAVAVLLWRSTHKLDPYREIASSNPPLDVQVVAQDWKWLFIYPEQNIAVVNELVFPSGTPVSLEITSDTVMNSFVIPALGGQIYAMAGMQTRLDLLANEPGHFWGRNVQYSGRGFADQQFRAIATTNEDFDAWVAKVKASSGTLDASTYEQLAKPSAKVPVTYYSGVEPNLFDTIIAKYRQGDDDHGASATEAETAE